VTRREAEAENAGKNLAGKGCVERAAAGHMWLQCCLQRQCLSAVVWLFRLRARKSVSSHLPVDG